MGTGQPDHGRTLPDHRSDSIHPTEQVIANSKCIRHDREGRVHGTRRGEEAAIHDVEIVDFVRSAVAVERRCARVVAETDGTVLVCHAREWNPLSYVEVAGE